MRAAVNRCTATILKYKYYGFCSRYLVTLAASRIPYVEDWRWTFCRVLTGR